MTRSELDFTMSWTEYANYIYDTTKLTENQAFSVVGELYDVSDAEIANHLGSSTSAISTQRNRINYNDLSKESQMQFVTPYVPATPSRIVGRISYHNTDLWPLEGTTGDVTIHASVQEGHNNYIIVVEDYIKEYEDDSNNIFAQYKDISKITIYDKPEKFLKMSPHSPRNVTEKEYYIECEGELFDK